MEWWRLNLDGFRSGAEGCYVGCFVCAFLDGGCKQRVSLDGSVDVESLAGPGYASVCLLFSDLILPNIPFPFSLELFLIFLGELLIDIPAYKALVTNDILPF